MCGNYKSHGGASKEEVLNKNDEALENGMHNLYKHIDNLKNVYGLNVIVALNKYNTDLDEEIKFVKEQIEGRGYKFSIVEGWAKGGEGAKDISEKIIELAKNEKNLTLAYKDEDSVKDKILQVAQKIYGAENVEYTEEAEKNIKRIELMGYGNLPICIAKTQYSLSDDPKKLECNDKFDITVRDVVLKAGAGFIVVLAGKIMTMPGLPKVPAAENIGFDEKENIKGIF